MSARAEGASSHWMSSTATMTGSASASRCRTPSSPSPTARSSAGDSPAGSSRSATRSALSCGSGSSAINSVVSCEQIGDPGEGEAGLGLERPRDQDASARRAGGFAARQPERRLPRAGLTLEQERRGPIVPARDERLDRSELLLPPDDLVHLRLPRRWCRSPTSVSSQRASVPCREEPLLSRRSRSCARPPSPRFAPRRSG